jgi:hypothetical protein
MNPLQGIKMQPFKTCQSTITGKSRPIRFGGPLKGEDPGLRIMGQVRQAPTTDGAGCCELETQYLRWNQETQKFELMFERALAPVRENVYTSTWKTNYPLKQSIPVAHGEMLSADLAPGAVVDQINQRILFADGRWMDGPTGDLYNAHDMLILSRDTKRHPKPSETKDC